MDTNTNQLPGTKIKVISSSFFENKEQINIDITSILKYPKNLKFMSKQDIMAVKCCHELFFKYPLSSTDLEQRTGIYFCMGVLPFDQKDLVTLANHSTENGEFSISSFATNAMKAINPLMTFKCLPNMPVFHISLNFGIKSEYMVSYPGVFQTLQVLEQAISDLKNGKVDYAIVGAVTDQQNPLVQEYLKKIGADEVPAHDVAGAWLLSLNHGASEICLDELQLNYTPIDYFSNFNLKNDLPSFYGPAKIHYLFNEWLNGTSGSTAISYKESSYEYKLQFSRVSK